ncbi:MAG: Uma2 family endonuclease [Emticicia sp.]|uniref:Uma2 family endonuclease n=1 Tax=Emticicia sp. TaxID=1930953 RepID=UPI003BA5A34E
MVVTKSPQIVRKSAPKVPDYLIHEVMDGKPIYYRGYKEVLNGTKTFAEIMGSSTLQSLIITHLIILLGRKVDEEKYTLLSSETGIHLNKYNNLAGDILIFENSVLPIEAIDEHYAIVPPKVAIEVDINIEAPGLEIDSYIFNKTQKLLNFGVEKVIWITTKSKKVTVATRNEDWQVKDWNKDIEVFDGIIFNIGEYLRKKGSPFA